MLALRLLEGLQKFPERKRHQVAAQYGGRNNGSTLSSVSLGKDDQIHDGLTTMKKWLMKYLEKDLHMKMAGTRHVLH